MANINGYLPFYHLLNLSIQHERCFIYAHRICEKIESRNVCGGGGFAEENVHNNSIVNAIFVLDFVPA